MTDGSVSYETMTITPTGTTAITMADLSSSAESMLISVQNILTTFGPTVVGSEQRPIQGTVL